LLNAAPSNPGPPLVAVTQVESNQADVPTFAPRAFSLGVYLVVKGFKHSPITAGMTASSTRPAYQDAA
jgi:hypothetical protein